MVHYHVLESHSVCVNTDGLCRGVSHSLSPNNLRQDIHNTRIFCDRQKASFNRRNVYLGALAVTGGSAGLTDDSLINTGAVAIYTGSYTCQLTTLTRASQSRTVHQPPLPCRVRPQGVCTSSQTLART